MIMLLPLFLYLRFGAIFAGYFFKEIFIGHDSKNFWKNSILFLDVIKHDHLPLWLNAFHTNSCSSCDTYLLLLLC